MAVPHTVVMEKVGGWFGKIRKHKEYQQIVMSGARVGMTNPHIQSNNGDDIKRKSFIMRETICARWPAKV